NIAYSFLKPLHISKDHLKHLKKFIIKEDIPDFGKTAILPVDFLKDDEICSIPVNVTKIFFLKGFAEKTVFSKVKKSNVFKRILAYSFIPLGKFNKSQMNIINVLSNIPAVDVYLKKGEYLAEKI
ncbi:hypothetical protein J7L48_00330, partial [bacterium]|nr:hypothetical protein [bacterium]